MKEHQDISLEKSEVAFSGGVDLTVASNLAAELGVALVDKHQIYLGLPASVGRSIIELFQALVNQVAIVCKVIVSMASEMKIPKGVIETDSLQVFSTLSNRRVDLSYSGNIKADILSICSCFDSFSFSWVKRIGNTPAHNLARLSFNSGFHGNMLV